MCRMLVSLILIVFIHIVTARRRCINSGILFPDKILRSPIVLYGESIGKQVYLDNDIELLFNVTFRVDCIFKGQDVPNRIILTQAGVKTGHTACQWLEPGQLYVVFVEKWGTQIDGYRPLDFQERLVDPMTYELLEKTCHLKRLQPLQSKENRCPNVSVIDACPHDAIDVNIIPKQKYMDNVFTNTKNSYFNNAGQFYLQTNVTIPKEGSAAIRFGDNISNRVPSRRRIYTVDGLLWIFTVLLFQIV